MQFSFLTNRKETEYENPLYKTYVQRTKLKKN